MKFLNIPNIKIIDILENNSFKTLIQFNRSLNSDITQMKYNSIISAVPLKWKKIIKNLTVENYANFIRLNDEPQLKINNSIKPLSKCNNKNIYLTLLCKNIKTPTALDTWINIFPFLETESWVYKRTFEITKEPYLQSFQFKILNRNLNNNENLYKWKILENNKCHVCEEVDGIEHHLFFGKDSSSFWKRLKAWMLEALEFCFEFTVCEILFGLPTNNYVDTKLLNFLILMGKWYINKKKSNKNPIYFFEYLAILRDKVNTLTYIPDLEGLAVKPWLETLQEVL